MSSAPGKNISFFNHHYKYFNAAVASYEYVEPLPGLAAMED
jgi:hypothetical protein